MEAGQEEVHYQPGVALEGDAVIEVVVVFLEHCAPEVLDLGEDFGEGHFLGFDAAAVYPYDAHHLVDFETHERPHHGCPLIGGLRGGPIFYELFIVAVQWEFGLIVFTTDGWSWAVSFTCADVKEAQLMPDEAANVGVERIKAIGFTIAMEAHTFSHADGCTDKY